MLLAPFLSAFCLSFPTKPISISNEPTFDLDINNGSLPQAQLPGHVMESIIGFLDINSAFKTAHALGLNETTSFISHQINGLRTHCNDTTFYYDIFAPFISAFSYDYTAEVPRECLLFLAKNIKFFRPRNVLINPQKMDLDAMIVLLKNLSSLEKVSLHMATWGYDYISISPEEIRKMVNELLRIDIKHLEINVDNDITLYEPLISSHPTVEKLTLLFDDHETFHSLIGPAFSNTRLVDLNINALPAGTILPRSPIVLSDNLRHLTLDFLIGKDTISIENVQHIKTFKTASPTFLDIFLSNDLTTLGLSSIGYGSIHNFPYDIPDTVTSVTLFGGYRYPGPQLGLNVFPTEFKNITSFSSTHCIRNLFYMHHNPPLKELTWTYYDFDDIEHVNRFIQESETLEKMTIKIVPKSLNDFIRIYPYHFQLKNARKLTDLNIEFADSGTIKTKCIYRLLNAIYDDVKKNVELMDRLTVNGYSLKSALKQSRRRDLPKLIHVTSPDSILFSIEPVTFPSRY
jgi:hypothetical protein